MFITVAVVAGPKHLRPQDDTVRAPNVQNIPTIDGRSDDACWSEVSWQEIDQVWIPYGDSVGESDYTGKYKVVWSETENVLYFVVEVTDDVFVDGYVYDDTDFHNYDVVEVFIDEDDSDGAHLFDSGEENAENAFAYHINVDVPSDGNTTDTCVVCDIAGTSWMNRITPDYVGHFPEFAMRKDSNQYTWEFSLRVYDDTYDDSDPEASRVNLFEGKIMGLSLAYCDNDSINEQLKERDNFFGSVWVPEEENNDHYKNADGFGTLELIADSSGIDDNLIIPEMSFLSYSNPFADRTFIEFELPKTSKVKIEVFDLLGQSVGTIVEKRFSAGRHTVHWTHGDVSSGIYFCRMQANSFKDTKKLLIIK